MWRASKIIGGHPTGTGHKAEGLHMGNPVFKCGDME
jgi:hypothetical protein